MEKKLVSLCATIKELCSSLVVVVPIMHEGVDTSKEKFLKFSRNERDSTIFVSRLISFPFVQARDNFSASKMKRFSIKRTASSGQREFVGVYRRGEIFFDQIAG